MNKDMLKRNLNLFEKKFNKKLKVLKIQIFSYILIYDFSYICI